MFTSQDRTTWRNCKPGTYTVVVTYKRTRTMHHFCQPSLQDAVECANFCASLDRARDGVSIVILDVEDRLQMLVS